MLYLSFLYEKWKGVKHDHNIGFNCYLASAEKGNSISLCNLGFCHEKRRGVKQDYSKAVEYYIQSADKGNT